MTDPLAVAARVLSITSIDVTIITITKQITKQITKKEACPSCSRS